MSNKIREFTIRMDDEHAKELARMSEVEGEDNDLVFLEKMVVDTIIGKDDFHRDFGWLAYISPRSPLYMRVLEAKNEAIK